MIFRWSDLVELTHGLRFSRLMCGADENMEIEDSDGTAYRAKTRRGLAFIYVPKGKHLQMGGQPTDRNSVDAVYVSALWAHLYE